MSQEIISKQEERFKGGLESCFQKEPVLMLCWFDSSIDGSGCKSILGRAPFPGSLWLCQLYLYSPGLYLWLDSWRHDIV